MRNYSGFSARSRRIFIATGMSLGLASTPIMGATLAIFSDAEYAKSTFTASAQLPAPPAPHHPQVKLAPAQSTLGLTEDNLQFTATISDAERSAYAATAVAQLFRVENGQETAIGKKIALDPGALSATFNVTRADLGTATSATLKVKLDAVAAHDAAESNVAVVNIAQKEHVKVPISLARTDSTPIDPDHRIFTLEATPTLAPGESLAATAQIQLFRLTGSTRTPVGSAQTLSGGKVSFPITLDPGDFPAAGQQQQLSYVAELVAPVEGPTQWFDPQTGTAVAVTVNGPIEKTTVVPVITINAGQDVIVDNQQPTPSFTVSITVPADKPFIAAPTATITIDGHPVTATFNQVASHSHEYAANITVTDINQPPYDSPAVRHPIEVTLADPADAPTYTIAAASAHGTVLAKPVQRTTLAQATLLLEEVPGAPAGTRTLRAHIAALPGGIKYPAGTKVTYTVDGGVEHTADLDPESSEAIITLRAAELAGKSTVTVVAQIKQIDNDAHYIYPASTTATSELTLTQTVTPQWVLAVDKANVPAGGEATLTATLSAGTYPEGQTVTFQHADGTTTTATFRNGQALAIWRPATPKNRTVASTAAFQVSSPEITAGTTHYAASAPSSPVQVTADPTQWKNTGSGYLQWARESKNQGGGDKKTFAMDSTGQVQAADTDNWLRSAFNLAKAKPGIIYAEGSSYIDVGAKITKAFATSVRCTGPQAEVIQAPVGGVQMYTERQSGPQQIRSVTLEQPDRKTNERLYDNYGPGQTSVEYSAARDSSSTPLDVTNEDFSKSTYSASATGTVMVHGYWNTDPSQTAGNTNGGPRITLKVHAECSATRVGGYREAAEQSLRGVN